MVADLLRGFVDEPWVEHADLASLERVPEHFVSADLRERADDLIWRLRWGEDWLYVYLLLEFQSSEDPHMALRVMTYVGLLYESLVRGGATGAGERALPPVLPVVLYNGNVELVQDPYESEIAMKLTVVLEASDEGGYTVYVPSLPGCVSEGGSKEEAMQNIREAIELYLEPVDDDMGLDPDAEVTEIAV